LRKGSVTLHPIPGLHFEKDDTAPVGRARSGVPGENQPCAAAPADAASAAFNANNPRRRPEQPPPSVAAGEVTDESQPCRDSPRRSTDNPLQSGEAPCPCRSCPVTSGRSCVKYNRDRRFFINMDNRYSYL